MYTENELILILKRCENFAELVDVCSVIKYLIDTKEIRGTQKIYIVALQLTNQFIANGNI